MTERMASRINTGVPTSRPAAFGIPALLRKDQRPATAKTPGSAAVSEIGAVKAESRLPSLNGAEPLTAADIKVRWGCLPMIALGALSWVPVILVLRWALS